MAAIQRWRAPNRADSAKQADERWHSAQRHGGTAGPQGKWSPNTVNSLKAMLITLDLIIRELELYTQYCRFYFLLMIWLLSVWSMFLYDKLVTDGPLHLKQYPFPLLLKVCPLTVFQPLSEYISVNRKEFPLDKWFSINCMGVFALLSHLHICFSEWGVETTHKMHANKQR